MRLGSRGGLEGRPAGGRLAGARPEPYDFSPERYVEIRYPFGCTHKINAAFVVVRPAASLAAVFSEHAGYLEFELVEGCAVVEIREDIYWQS
ncbi:hypothetical protein [Roseateles sp. P5_D6]